MRTPLSHGARWRPGAIGGDRGLDRERCRTLDIAARIVFGVSVMDRQIEGYLVSMSRLDMWSDEYRRYVVKIHKMDFRARADIVKRHIRKESVDVLFNEIKEIRMVRNMIAHSTADVNAEGTVILNVEEIDEVVGGGTAYTVDMLAEVLKKTDQCNSGLREIFRDASTTVLNGGKE